MNYINLLLLLFLSYWFIVMVLDRQGILNKYNITAYGPILMIRTTRGQEFLDRLAVYKGFWRRFADIGLPAMLISMLAMLLLILFVDFQLISSFQTRTVPMPTKFNEPRNIFLIPGINEFIPLYWGVIGLVITLMVHEFSHAILCKVEGIRVKSMGILLALFPVGGFAEPDEEQLSGNKGKNVKDKEILIEGSEPKKLITRRERVRILSAGVMANFVTACISFIIFFLLLGSISPVGEVMITDVIPGSPADLHGVKQNMILSGINDEKINNATDFLMYSNKLTNGSNVKLDVVENGERKVITFAATGKTLTRTGIKVLEVTDNSPAKAAGITEGMIIARVDNTEIKDFNDFFNFMNSTTEGQKIDVYLLSNDSLNASIEEKRGIVLAKYPYQSNTAKGYLGVSSSPEEGAISYSTGIGIGQFQAGTYLNMLQSIPSTMTGIRGWILLFGLPIFGFSGEGFQGFSGILANFYEPTGWAAPLGIGLFWILNILLWVGWINFYAGLFNCLPAIPFDGGHVFRDVMASLLSKIFKNEEKVEVISNGIVLIFAILIFMSFIFVTIAPYAAHGF